MSESIVYKLLGPTTLLTVINTAHKAVTVSSAEISNYTAFMNIGGAPIQVVVVPGNVNNPPDATFPTDALGGAQPGFTVPPLMQVPMLVATPSPFQMSAISNSATASTLVVIPAGNV